MIFPWNNSLFGNWNRKNHLIYVTGIKVSKILLQFVLFYDTLTVYAENKRKRQHLQILVFTGVGLLQQDDFYKKKDRFIVLLTFQNKTI